MHMNYMALALVLYDERERVVINGEIEMAKMLFLFLFLFFDNTQDHQILLHLSC